MTEKDASGSIQRYQIGGPVSLAGNNKNTSALKGSVGDQRVSNYDCSDPIWQLHDVRLVEPY
jgi:hypothetical protein